MIGPDAKGKYPTLEGRTVTFSIKDCPPSVEIQDEAAVPSDYKAITITMPALKWEDLSGLLDLEQQAAVLDSVEKPRASVSKTAVKAAISGGAQVPGADLIVGKKTLIRRHASGPVGYNVGFRLPVRRGAGGNCARLRGWRSGCGSAGQERRKTIRRCSFR